MINIMHGKKISEEIKTKLSLEIKNLKIPPKLIVIQIGNDKASDIYVKNKSKSCKDVGIEFEDINLPEDTTRKDLLKIIENYNVDKKINGIIIQQPVPQHLKGLEQYISPEKDVDGFTYNNLGRLITNESNFIPCTTKGIIDLLNENSISISGKHVVVVGRSNIVGKPTAIELLNRNATVTICHSKTKNLKQICRQSDILIVAIGKPKFISGEYIGENTNVVIDVGINRLDNGTICGDTDYEDIISRWEYLDKNHNVSDRYITPVPRWSWTINSC